MYQPGKKKCVYLIIKKASACHHFTVFFESKLGVLATVLFLLAASTDFCLSILPKKNTTETSVQMTFTINLYYITYEYFTRAMRLYFLNNANFDMKYLINILFQKLFSLKL